MKQIFIYADETEQEINGEKYLGYGFLFCNAKIEESFISNLKFKLKKDYSIIINNFHACEDNSATKQEFIKAINNEIDCEFFFCYSKKPDDLGIVKKELNSLFIHAFLNNTFEPKEVNIFVENRKGLNKKYLEEIINSLHTNIIHSAYEITTIPHCINPVNVEISDKNEPGIQVIDILLWVAARKSLRNDDSLFSLLNKKILISISPVAGISSLSFRLNNEPQGLFNYPSDGEIYVNNLEPKNISEFYSIFSWIIDIVFEVANNEIPIQITHLSKELAGLKKQLTYEKTNMPKIDTLDRICRLFIMIFDTLPIYDEMEYSLEDWRIALTAKKMSALVLNKQLINGAKSRLFIHNFRVQKYQQLI